MRAVLVGLVGAVVLVGGAQAACAPDGMEFVTSGVTPKGLEGSYKVVKSASEFRHWDKPIPRRYTQDGWVHLLLEHEGKRYYVKQIYDLRTDPEEYGESHSAFGPEAKSVQWGKHNRAAESARFTPSFPIQMGPLAGVNLNPAKPTSCE